MVRARACAREPPGTCAGRGRRTWAPAKFLLTVEDRRATLHLRRIAAGRLDALGVALQVLAGGSASRRTAAAERAGAGEHALEAPKEGAHLGHELTERLG